MLPLTLLSAASTLSIETLASNSYGPIRSSVTVIESSQSSEAAMAPPASWFAVRAGVESLAQPLGQTTHSLLEQLWGPAQRVSHAPQRDSIVSLTQAPLQAMVSGGHALLAEHGDFQAPRNVPIHQLIEAADHRAGDEHHG